MWLGPASAHAPPTSERAGHVPAIDALVIRFATVALPWEARRHSAFSSLLRELHAACCWVGIRIHFRIRR